MTSEIRLDTIKARSGLGTVSVNSSGINAAGIVTASFFYGDGSNLTNLSGVIAIKNIQAFVTSGPYTYTPTPGTSSFIVIATGAGGGGGQGGSGGNGTNTTFDPNGTGETLTGFRGFGGNSGVAEGAGGTASGGQLNITGGTGVAAYQLEGGGGSSFWGGQGTYGAGGGAGYRDNSTQGSGGAGGTAIRCYNSTQMGTGASGTIGSGGSSGGANANAGSDGAVVIIEY